MGVIHAPQPLLATTEASKLISVDSVEEILNEVIPAGSRGAKVRDEGGFQSSLTYQFGTSYEHVKVMHVRHDCKSLQPKCEVSATVNFKRALCESLTK